jgi:hypothetical protein
MTIQKVALSIRQQWRGIQGFPLGLASMTPQALAQGGHWGDEGE